MAESRWHFDALNTRGGAAFIGWRPARHEGEAEPALEHPCHFVQAPLFQPELLGSAALAAAAAARGFAPRLQTEGGEEVGFDSLAQATEFLRRAYTGGGGNPTQGEEPPGPPPDDGGGGPFEPGLAQALKQDWPEGGGALSWQHLAQLPGPATDALVMAGRGLLKTWIGAHPRSEAEAARWLQGALELAALSQPLSFAMGVDVLTWDDLMSSNMVDGLPRAQRDWMYEEWHVRRLGVRWPLHVWPWPHRQQHAADAFQLLRRQPCPSRLAAELRAPTLNLQQALLRFLARPVAFRLSPASEAMLLWAAAVLACQSLGPAPTREEVWRTTLDWLRQSLPSHAFAPSIEALLAPQQAKPQALGAPA